MIFPSTDLRLISLQIPGLSFLPFLIMGIFSFFQSLGMTSDCHNFYGIKDFHRIKLCRALLPGKQCLHVYCLLWLFWSGTADANTL